MGKLVIGVIAFAGGVGVGLLLAKLYVRNQVQGTADALLDKAGLGGGKIQALVDTVIVPAVT